MIVVEAQFQTPNNGTEVLVEAADGNFFSVTVAVNNNDVDNGVSVGDTLLAMALQHSDAAARVDLHRQRPV